MRSERTFGVRLVPASLTLCLLVLGPASAQDEKPLATETVATSAYILDAETGTVLLEKAPDERFEPASLAKIMTVETILDAMEASELTGETTYPVSDHAWRTGGAPSRTATMFAAVRSNVPVDALLRGVMIQGANDAAIILGEGLAGTESAFALRMNQRATELGLTNSHFVNATGLPERGQFTTARDMALLSAHLREAHADRYATYRDPEFEWNRVLQRNRNPLLRLEIGATGLATGFTEGRGYAIAALAETGDRRTVAVLAGLESEALRTKETARLLAWAQDTFERRLLFAKGATVGTANVFGGLDASVTLVSDHDLAAYVPKDRADLVRAEIRYDAPLRAPIAQGDRIGKLHVSIDDKPAFEADLFAGATVKEGTFSARALDAVQELAFGWIRGL